MEVQFLFCIPLFLERLMQVIIKLLDKDCFRVVYYVCCPVDACGVCHFCFCFFMEEKNDILINAVTYLVGVGKI